MRLARNAALLAFAGLVIGAIHSYCAPINLRPANNPDPPAAEASKAAPAPANGAKPAAATPDPADTQKGAEPPAEQAKAADPPKPPVATAPTPNYFIDPDRAKQLFDRGQAQHDVFFIDARPAKDYLAGHVKGAMHLPPETVAGRPPQKVDFLPGMTVVVYCHGATCTDSEAVMIRLQNLKRDIGPIYIMKDGFDAWKARGWPIESGPDQNG